MTTAMVLLSTWMESQVEFWVPIEGSLGYDISNHGRVRSYWIKRHRKGVLSDTPHIMRPQISVKHADIVLNGGGKKRRAYIHRLVASAFLPNPDHLPEVNHITAYPADNRVDGLEWVTHFGNHQHAKVNGLHAQGSRNGMGVLAEAQVLDIRRRLLNKEKQKDIAAVFNTTPSNISQIKSGRRWGHI